MKQRHVSFLSASLVLCFFSIQIVWVIAADADEAAASGTDADDMIDLDSSDPLTLESYEELTQNARSLVEEGDNLYLNIDDTLADGMLNPFGGKDPSCQLPDGEDSDADCYRPPKSTLSSTQQTCSENSDDGTSDASNTCIPGEVVDKHWGSDRRILEMRDALREPSPNNDDDTQHPFDQNKRPPIFLMPGLASTRLVSWKHKPCPHILTSDVKFHDYVWLNLNLLVQMGAIEAQCWEDCMKLGPNQTDSSCKLRPDEGLDAIASLAPDSVGAGLLVGQANTLFAWLVQWLADNLGYDVGNMIGLPYDWRLSPEMTEKRDGFLSMTRRRIEAAVKTNGGVPGIMVAHSMGNSMFRYFLEWLRQEMRDEAYERFVKQAERRKSASSSAAAAAVSTTSTKLQQQIDSANAPSAPGAGAGWLAGVASGLEEVWNSYFGEEEEEGEEGEGWKGGEGKEQEKGSNEKDTYERMKHGKYWKYWELAKLEGDANYNEWLKQHIWTYVGLSAPLLGAVNPLRSVISGENMGLPLADDSARRLELTFGCTHTVNPVSSQMAFCDQWNSPEQGEGGGEDDDGQSAIGRPRRDLLCLDDLVRDIEESTDEEDPWGGFPQLKSLLKDRVDWSTGFPMISIVEEDCSKSSDGNGADDGGEADADDDRKNREKKKKCLEKISTLGAKEAQRGEVFDQFGRVWNEEDNPMKIKREQLENSFWKTSVPNVLNRTWDRPYIKHVIMAYGVDIPTEVGYEYKKKDDEETRKRRKEDGYDGMPKLSKIIWETKGGVLLEETAEITRGGLADYLTKKKPKRRHMANGTLIHSGDGTVPYLSLSWVHTWLLHAIRAKRYNAMDTPSSDSSRYVLDDVKVTHRPEGEMEWKPGPSKVRWEQRKLDPDTGTSHPHGTRYKPEMVKFQTFGKSRRTGMTYSTTVIEVAGVEHKETTRNYDILAAVFSEVLIHLHDDFDLV